SPRPTVPRQHTGDSSHQSPPPAYFHHPASSLGGLSRLQCVDSALSLSGTRALAPGRYTVGKRELWADRCGHIQRQEAADCSCTRLGADSPSTRAKNPDNVEIGRGAPGCWPLRSIHVAAALSRGGGAAHVRDAKRNGEVTTGARDGAAHVLRCLKVWYDLPADVLISAINLFDRFLTKMKVRPCHVPCITVSCMNIALEQYAADTDTKRSISVEELVSISQSACTAGDVLRMSRVIVDKLSLVAGCRVVTALDWLRLLRSMLMLQADHLGVGLPAGCQEEELVQMLEIVSCDAACVNTRTSELALVLLYYKLEQQLAEWSANEENMIPEEHAYYLFDFARQMNEASLVAARARVRHVVSRYERCEARRDRQRLVWRLSERTLKVLRPTDRLTSLLPTIEEQHFAIGQCYQRNRRRDIRLASQSSSTGIL
ncbi:hypothetical protein SFRURICE_014266, partial [Spodoptera frugiperda]